MFHVCRAAGNLIRISQKILKSSENMSCMYENKMQLYKDFGHAVDQMQ